MILISRMRFASFYLSKLPKKAARDHTCGCYKNFSDSVKRCSNSAIHTKNISSISSTTSDSKEVLHPVRSIIDENNIFRSRHEDVKISPDLVHQFVWKDVASWWNNTALVCAVTGRSYTYKELRKLCGKFATSLQRKQFPPGTTLAVVLPNVPEYAIVVLGASEAGVGLTLMNSAFTAHEMKKQLDNSKATAVVTNDANYAMIMECLNSSKDSICKEVIVVTDGSAPSGAIDFRDLIADDVEEFEKTGGVTRTNAEVDTMALLYSSGTTGLPKGVEFTHRVLVAGMCQIDHPEYHFFKPAIDGHQDIEPVFLPLSHVFGLTICFLGPLRIGAKLICMPQFTSNSLLDVLEKNRITNMFAVPPVIQLMVYDGRFSKKHLSDTKAVGCGAAPLTTELITQFRSKMGSNVEIYQGYGLTETTGILTSGRNSSPESVGFIVRNTQIRIVGQGEGNVGKNLGFNGIGEIFVRGPQVIKGYFNNTTEDCVDGDWFKTGDLGYVDEQGELFITGRLKDLIKVQGYQVSPTELENIIYEHDKVADVAVVGVPHNKFGEVPKAFVVLKKGVEVTEDEIKDFVANQVVKYKQIAHVVFTDKILKSPAGKILRKELQKL